MKLIVGLGNPGDKYQNTRHNLGFAVVDNFAKQFSSLNFQFSNNKQLKSEILKTNDLVLAKPQTFMNNSGMAVSQLASYFKIAISEIIVVHDDLDLPLGKIKIRTGGSAAGHHGVESIIKYLGDDKFNRIRLGIGNLHSLAGERKSKHFNVEEFVVNEFDPSETVKIKKIIKESVEILQSILDKGIEKTQNQYN
jgi:peptidyl-tRNA hydrolase, PTH1 family